jgi:DNA-binding NarL/FixJ family response regulator
MTSDSATILLADDHVLFRDGLRDLINHWEEFKVIGEVANGLEAVGACKQ